MKTFAALTVSCLTACSLTACGAAPRTLVGPAGGEVLVALDVGEDGAVIAYACDGHDGRVTTSRWFTGALDGDAIALRGDDGAVLVGTLRDGAFTGALDLGAGGEVPVS